jgi:hypothetical protein
MGDGTGKGFLASPMAPAGWIGGAMALAQRRVREIYAGKWAKDVRVGTC